MREVDKVLPVHQPVRLCPVLVLLLKITDSIGNQDGGERRMRA